MSDAVMVPRGLARAWVEARRTIQAEPETKYAVRNCIRAEADLSSAIEEAMLAASTPVGGWEEAEREEALALLRTINRECDIGRHEADVLSIIDRLAAPPPPSVSIDNGSRPQEAVPTEGPADDAGSFLRRVSEAPQTDIDLEYLATNVLFGRGSLSKEVRRDAVVAVKTLRAILKDARRLTPESAEGFGESCPLCAVPFKADDICAIDITEGTCHAACLEGSPIVDLDTEEPSDGPIFTFRYGSDEGIPTTPQPADGCSSNEGAE